MTRRWWAAEWINVCLAAYFFLFAAHALVGLLEPSPSISRVLQVGSILYAAVAAALAFLGLVAVLTRQRRAEGLVIVCLAVVTLLHGALLIAAGAGGIVTGLRLAAAPLMMVPFAVLRQRVTLSVDTLHRIAGDRL